MKAPREKPPLVQLDSDATVLHYEAKTNEIRYSAATRKRLTDLEFEVALKHEEGHFRDRHLLFFASAWKRALSFGLSIGDVYVVFVMHPGIPFLVALIVGTIALPTVLAASVLWIAEFRADDYAVRDRRELDAFGSMLRTLAENVTYPRFLGSLRSHPPIPLRIHRQTRRLARMNVE